MGGEGTGTLITGISGGGGIVTQPTIEPITMAELKLDLRMDSGSLADNIEESQSIVPGSHGIHELMTLDVAPGGAGWAAGDTITGVSSGETCIVVEVLTTTTYYVRDRSGTFTLGEVLTNGTDTADQGATYPTFATGYYLIGSAVEVLGYDAVVMLNAGTNGASGTVDVKIQESDDTTTWTDWSSGAFTQVTTANDNAVYEKAYTGTKRYVRAVAKVLVAACEFGASVIRMSATSVEDDLLNDIITAAREVVEDMTRRHLLTQTWDYALDAWPAENYIRIPGGNLQSVSSVKWTDSDGTETTLTEDTDYRVEINGDQCGRVVLPNSVSWPSGTLYSTRPIVIRYVAGWTAAANVPKKIKQAVRMIAADMYENRQTQVLTNQSYQENKTVNRLLASVKLWDEF